MRRIQNYSGGAVSGGWDHAVERVSDLAGKRFVSRNVHGSDGPADPADRLPEASRLKLLAWRDVATDGFALARQAEEAANEANQKYNEARAAHLLLTDPNEASRHGKSLHGVTAAMVDSAKDKLDRAKAELDRLSQRRDAALSGAGFGPPGGNL